MSQPHTKNFQPEGTTASTNQPEGSNIKPKEITACTDQTQGSNLQTQGTAVCTNQPQASSPKPQLTIKLDENQFQHSSWAAKWDSQQKTSETVVSIQIFLSFKAFIGVFSLESVDIQEGKGLLW